MVVVREATAACAGVCGRVRSCTCLYLCVLCMARGRCDVLVCVCCVLGVCAVRSASCVYMTVTVGVRVAGADVLGCNSVGYGVFVSFYLSFSSVFQVRANALSSGILLIK